MTDGNFTMAEGEVSITSTNDAAILLATSNVSAASQASVRFIQDHTGGAVPVVELKQDDVDDAFINFTGTAGAGSSLNTNTTSGATTHHVTVEINGTKAYIAASTNAPS